MIAHIDSILKISKKTLRSVRSTPSSLKMRQVLSIIPLRLADAYSLALFLYSIFMINVEMYGQKVSIIS